MLDKKIARNAIFTAFSQHFHTKYKITNCYWWTKKNFNGRFELKPVKTYYLGFVVKM